MEEKEKKINTFQCLWIYSVLALFDKPLLPDYCGMMNEILTFAVKNINNLKQEGQVETNQEILASLYIICLVIMEYFGQRLYNL